MEKDLDADLGEAVCAGVDVDAGVDVNAVVDVDSDEDEEADEMDVDKSKGLEVSVSKKYLCIL